MAETFNIGKEKNFYGTHHIAQPIYETYQHQKNIG